MWQLLGKVALGAALGYVVHRLSLLATGGGGCPLLCSPWRAMVIGAIFGWLTAWPTGGQAVATGQSLSGLLGHKEGKTMSVNVAAGVPVHVTEDGLAALVQQTKVPILLDAYADWCGPCKMLAPELEQVAKELGDRVVVAKLNVDESPRVAQALNIRGIPAMFVIRGDKVVDGWTGFMPAETVKEQLAKHLGS